MSTNKNFLVTKFLGKVPLRAVLIVPFVLQIVAAVGLVGYLSFRNSQQAINDVASQLRHTTTTHIEDRLRTYIETPQTNNQSNANVIESGLLNVQNIVQLKRLLWRQIQMSEGLSFVYLGTRDGDYFAAERRPETGVLLNEESKSTNGQIYVYRVDGQGNQLNLFEKLKKYDPRQRPWYKAAMQAGKPTWVEIYTDFTTKNLVFTAAQPIYEPEGRLLGVLGSDLSLVKFNKFLQNLKIGTTGSAFIMERSGNLVMSSTTAPVQVTRGNETERIKATESENKLIRETAQYLEKRFVNLSAIDKTQELSFSLDGAQQFLDVTPLKDNRGLNWLIVVAIPESDFMAQINANTRTTILLCIATSIVAIIISIPTSRWVTQPLIRLNVAAKDIAKGECDKTVNIDRSDEVGQLAKSFNNMARQLKTSFENLNSVIYQAKQVGIKITTSATQIAAVGKQLEATATSQATSTKKIKATAENIATTSGELVQTTENITQRAQSTASAVSNSQADLMEMATAMGQLAEATNSISFRLGVMIEKANNINSVVTTISKVADQTNLISLNAAIEAEKAGEYGAGFAVVAREIRRLADQTAFATQEIEFMVKEIQSSVTKGVMEMDKFSKQVSNYVEQVGRISGQMAEVNEQVQSLTPHFEAVSHTMERQFEGASQISMAISQLSEAAQRNVESLKQANQALDRLDDTAQSLKEIISTEVAL